MSLLDQVTRVERKTGQRIVLAGAEGVGKTTLACSASRPLLIPMEMSRVSFPVDKVPLIESFPSLCGLLEDIGGRYRAGKFPFQTLVFDTATAAERLIHARVIETDPSFKAGNKTGLTMESAHGGYGKAYNVANDMFAQLTRYCDELAIHAGITSVFTCHVFAAHVVDPAHGEYDTWDLQLHSPKNQKTYGKREFLTQWADLIGYLHEPMFIMKAEKGQTMTKGQSLNQGRVLAVDRQPGWVAKNRYGLTGTIPIPKEKGWNAIAHAIYEATNKTVDVWNKD